MGFGHTSIVCVKLMNRATALSGRVEMPTCVTATIARLLGVVFREIKAAARSVERLPRRMSGAPVACALFPLGLMERLTSPDPT